MNFKIGLYAIITACAFSVNISDAQEVVVVGDSHDSALMLSNDNLKTKVTAMSNSFTLIQQSNEELLAKVAKLEVCNARLRLYAPKASGADSAGCVKPPSTVRRIYRNRPTPKPTTPAPAPEPEKPKVVYELKVGGKCKEEGVIKQLVGVGTLYCKGGVWKKKLTELQIAQQQRSKQGAVSCKAGRRWMVGRYDSSGRAHLTIAGRKASKSQGISLHPITGIHFYKPGGRSNNGEYSYSAVACSKRWSKPANFMP